MSDTSLMVIPSEMTAVQLFAPGKADEILTAIESTVRSEAAGLDASTEDGRTALKSLAYKVKRTKTATDKMRLDLVSEEKKRLKKIDEEGARMWDRLEALEKEVRQPVTDFEEAEKARVKALEDRVAYLQSLFAFEFEPTIEQIAERLEKAKNADMENRQEFDRRLLQAQQQAITILEPMLAGAKAKEADRLAEIERQKAEAERIQKEREEAAAAKAKADAEERARKAAEEAAEAAERERVRLIQEAAAREAALKAEQERAALEAKAAQERIEREAAEREAAIERERKAAEERANRQAEEAAKRAEEEKAAAVKAEQERIRREKERAEEEERLRAENRKHAAKINGEAKASLLNHTNLTAENAEEVVKAIARGLVSHVSIRY